MSRSLKKGPFVDEHILKKVEEQSGNSSKKPIKTWSRRSTIIPDMIGFTFLVHNGKKFNQIFITDTMVDINLVNFS